MKYLIREGRKYEQFFHMREHEYESLVKKTLQRVLDEFVVVPFKVPVLGDEGIRRKADLALVHSDCRAWTVVEVELEHHSLTRHVEPQVWTLATGRYGRSHVEALTAALPSFDPGSLRALVEYSPPEILIAVNSASVLERGWGVLEDQAAVHLAFLEVFRPPAGAPIVSVGGYLPRVRADRVSGAVKHAMLNGLVVRDANTPLLRHDLVKISFGSRTSDWRVVRTADKALLIPTFSITLSGTRNYEILSDSEGRLILETL